MKRQKQKRNVEETRSQAAHPIFIAFIVCCCCSSSSVHIWSESNYINPLMWAYPRNSPKNFNHLAFNQDWTIAILVLRFPSTCIKMSVRANAPHSGSTCCWTVFLMLFMYIIMYVNAYLKIIKDVWLLNGNSNEKI